MIGCHPHFQKVQLLSTSTHRSLFVLSKILCNNSTSCNGIGEYSRVSTGIALKKVLSNIPTKKKDTENRAVCDCLGWLDREQSAGRLLCAAFGVEPRLTS